MNKSLYVLLLLASPSLGAPEVRDSLEEDLEEHAVSGVSGEHLLDSKENRRLDLEDSMEWSESTEILDENHAWHPKTVRSRKKRSVGEESQQNTPVMVHWVNGKRVEDKVPSEVLESRYKRSLGEDELETEDHAEKVSSEVPASRYKKSSGEDELETEDRAEMEMSEELQDYQESPVSDVVDSLEGRVSMEALEQNVSRRKRLTQTEEDKMESMGYDPDDEYDTGSKEDYELENSRRKRSLKEERDDLEAAESVVFIPAFLRLRKKRAYEECNTRIIEYRNNPNRKDLTPRHRCNEYCCYIVLESS